jgi:ABC-type uncharacterized transport system substrate-binding protein
VRKILILLFAVFLYAKNILILNSYSVKLLWTREELNGIFKILEDKPGINTYIEFMDTKIFRPTPKRLKDFYNYLKSKYKGISFDVVITTDDNALNFVRKYKNTPLFKSTKVFFAGVNNLTIKDLLDKNVFSGVFEKKEPLANLNLLKKSVNNLKTVYVVSDNSTSGNSVIKEYKSAFKNIKGYNFVYINSKNLEEVLNRIKNASNNSGMLLLTPLSFYLNGKHINYKYAIALISQYFNHPIVIHSDLYIKLKNNNIIGGKVTDGFSQGVTVAKKVVAYLEGKNLKSLGFTFEKANKLYLNVKNLEKFGVDAYSLGYDNAKYVNEPQSFYSKYRNWIISLGVLFFALISILAILFIKNRQLRKYNEIMEVTNKSLQDKINDDYKEKFYEEMVKILEDIILQFKYPIEQLKDESFEAKYLKNKIKELECFLNDEKGSFSLKKIFSEIKEKTPLKEKIEIKGDDFEVLINKEGIEKFMLNIFNFFEENKLIKKIFIEIKNRKIVLKILPESSEIYQKIFNSLYFLAVYLKYTANGYFRFYNDEKFLIYEIDFPKIG